LDPQPLSQIHDDRNGDHQARRALISERQLMILAVRAHELAARVRYGDFALIDAVDVVYDAAVRAGLVDNIGAFVVQAVVAKAFCDVPRGGR
jgi:hypothetical protein